MSPEQVYLFELASLSEGRLSCELAQEATAAFPYTQEEDWFMGMMKEFKEFAVKGNVVDMAVGIIIGAAFGTIVKSLVADVIMPPIGLLLGNVDFSQLFIVLKEGKEIAGPYLTMADATNAGAVTLNYGAFINTIVSFLIVAFAIFILVKNINRLKREEPAAPPPAPTTKECPHCFSTISIKAVRCPFCTSTIPE